MVERRFVGIIAAGIALVAAFVIVTSSGLFRAPTQEQETFVMRDLELKLRSINVLSKTENETMVEIIFDTYNPNRASVVLEAIQYSLYANDIRVAVSEIGERPEGFVSGSGRTFTMYSEYSMMLRDGVKVLKSDITAAVWDDIQNDAVQWRVEGTLFATDPVRQGGRELNFDFKE